MRYVTDTKLSPLNGFTQSLGDATFKQKVLEKHCKILDEALLATQQIEAWAIEVQEKETQPQRTDSKKVYTNEQYRKRITYCC